MTNYLLHLADTTLILAQRNSEWCAHGPILEQDIAITNISLDLIGQARNCYQYAAELFNKNSNNIHTEDTLAYLRNEDEFKNLLICELPNKNWAHTIVRQYLFSEFQYLLWQQLNNHADKQLAAIAEKSIKETTYHIRWSKEWVFRLGDGTNESHNKIATALVTLWPYTHEFFIPANYEMQVGIDFDAIHLQWLQKVKLVIDEATLTIPTNNLIQEGGKNGKHTKHLKIILDELQQLQRKYPNAVW